MPRKQKKHHVIYKTTCKINGKYYVGMHSTDDLNDGYIGSGKRLWNAIRKHGRENFEVEYLEFFDSRELLIEREKELVNDELLKDPMCMNLMRGGKGGFISDENQFKRSQAGGLARTKKCTAEKLSIIGKMGGFTTLKNKVGYFDPKNKRFNGKKHTEETKIKIKIGVGESQTGEKNSQFGTCWIKTSDNKISKRVKKLQLSEYLNNGWIIGMGDDIKNKIRNTLKH
jgi:group I intron endonuclease